MRILLACCPAAGHLLAFKTGLYDPLQALANWQLGSNPCGPEPWSGLVCKQGWVVAIRLKEMSLLGPLTPDLLQVSRLEELHLQNNALTGMCWARHVVVVAHNPPDPAASAHVTLRSGWHQAGCWQAD